MELFYIHQFGVENQRGIWRNYSTRTLLSITQFRWDDQFVFCSYAHQGNALVPTWDYLTYAQFEIDWLTSLVRVVELSAIVQLSATPGIGWRSTGS